MCFYHLIFQCQPQSVSNNFCLILNENKQILSPNQRNEVGIKHNDSSNTWNRNRCKNNGIIQIAYKNVIIYIITKACFSYFKEKYNINN